MELYRCVHTVYIHIDVYKLYIYSVILLRFYKQGSLVTTRRFHAVARNSGTARASLVSVPPGFGGFCGRRNERNIKQTPQYPEEIAI